MSSRETERASAQDPGPLPSGEIDLDPERAEQHRAARFVHLETRLVPRLRVLGFALLVAAVYLYNLQLGEPEWNAGLPPYILALILYCAGSWWILDRAYERLKPRVDLGLIFLIVDLPLLAWAVYLTGGDRSWLIALLVFRTADQATTTFRRALFFAHATTLAYLGLVGFLVFVEGRAVAWPTELTKMVLLYGGNLYIAFTARASDARRRNTANAIEIARGLIRDLEQQSAELESARVRAEVASETKSRFLANMSHELRTPMNAVMGLAEILTTSELSPHQRERLDLLRSSAGDLLSVIDDLLDFSRIEADELNLEPQDCDLPRMVSEILRRSKPQAEQKGLGLRLELDPALPTRVRLDPVRVRQVLSHLLGNAIKFTREGQVKVRVLEAGLDNTLVILHFEVEDSGPGFPEVESDRLFEPFTQADESLTREHGGTGLGLGFCRRLVKMMGGQIGVRQPSTRGSIFWFTVEATIIEPAVIEDQGAIAKEPGANPNPIGTDGAHGQTTATPNEIPARVLVVEDNPVNQLVAVEILLGLGLEVERASDGAEALTMLDAKSYDLVLMDCQMPVMDGYQATREIRRSEGAEKHTPIVAVTAHALEGDRERCLAAGMDDYLVKPLELELLTHTLARWIDLDSRRPAEY